MKSLKIKFWYHFQTGNFSNQASENRLMCVIFLRNDTDMSFFCNYFRKGGKKKVWFLPVQNILIQVTFARNHVVVRLKLRNMAKRYLLLQNENKPRPKI